MLKKFLFTAILFLYSLCSYSQNDPTPSTDTPQSDISSQTPTTTEQNDNRGTEVPRNNENRVDTSNLLQEEWNGTYEQQKKHSWLLYLTKAKTYWPSLIISFLLIFGIGISLLFTTALCKDQSLDPKTNLLRPIADRPYSYSRMQLFWWTTIILSTYLTFFFYTKGFLSALTPSMVILLGGGIAVSLFGKVMDDSQIQQDKKPDVQNNSIPSNVPVRHQDIEPSQGLFKDILSDEGGISIHRFQAVVFNIVFGLGFITAFIRNIKNESFPFLDFEGWQLALLGVSSAGYLSFKANENSKTTKLERQIEAATDPTPPTPPPLNPLAPAQRVDAPNPAEPTNAFKNLQERLSERGFIQ